MQPEALMQLSESESTDENCQISKQKRYFLDENGPTCFNCNKIGHISKDCLEINVSFLN